MNENVQDLPVNAPVVNSPAAEFDWDSYEKGDVFTDISKSDLEKMYVNTLSTIVEKDVLNGTVIALNKREVVINIGFKSAVIVTGKQIGRAHV